jgi:acyl-CoA synthetase (AMP-forming)/AMP-acid ligase II
MVILGVLPHSHIYGVLYISHLHTYRGDSIIVLPKFDMQQMLSCVPKYKINILTIVPPIIVAMSKSPDLLKKYDLSSVKIVLSGGAPLAKETINALLKQYPTWVMRQGYGSTEAAAAVTHTCTQDWWAGSSGSVISGTEVKIYSVDGIEVTVCDQEGELYVKSPSVIPGYLDDDDATKEIINVDAAGRWLRTGDIGLFRKAPSGDEHLFVVDRIKEMIKVKGNQVVPAELEECLLKHPAVADCGVVGVPDERAGELPRVYVQRSTNAAASLPDAELKKAIFDFVKDQKARYKWFDGGIVFIDVIPRSPSGKILRRVLRDRKDERIQKL